MVYVDFSTVKSFPIHPVGELAFKVYLQFLGVVAKPVSNSSLAPESATDVFPDTALLALERIL